MIEQRFSIGIDISADDFYVSLMWFNGKRYVIKGMLIIIHIATPVRR